MGVRVPVHIVADDPVSRAGITSVLRFCPDLELVEAPDRESTVAIIVVDRVDERAVRAIRTVSRGSAARVVLVVTAVDPGGLLRAIEAGACGVVRRGEATMERLSAAVGAAAKGDGTMPPDLLGRLLEHVGRMQREPLAPRGVAAIGLTEREERVLRLVADGQGTADIARTLAYSERTVKNIIHDITARHQLRNRAHAVAYAVREGLI